MIDLIGGIDGELPPHRMGQPSRPGDFARLAPYIPDQSDFRRVWLGRAA